MEFHKCFHIWSSIICFYKYSSPYKEVPISIFNNILLYTKRDDFSI